MKRCLEWQGSRHNQGYGIFWRDGKRIYAHREIYEASHGPIPKGMCVCHTCDNPPCINPEHLFLGTYLDNTRDMMSKGRFPIGERVSWSKLTDADVLEIRKIGNSTPRFLIAKRYGVHTTTIRDVLNNKKWKHLL